MVVNSAAAAHLPASPNLKAAWKPVRATGSDVEELTSAISDQASEIPHRGVKQPVDSRIYETYPELVSPSPPWPAAFSEDPGSAPHGGSLNW